MADADRKRRATAELAPLTPPKDTWSGRIIRWHLVPAHAGESVRWESVDDRWVAVSLGDGDDLGRAVVTGSGERRAVVDSYEEALIVAETWRT